MANHVYRTAMESLLGGGFNFSTQKYKVMLLRSYTFDFEHSTYQDLLDSTPTPTVVASSGNVSPTTWHGLDPAPYVAMRCTAAAFSAVAAGDPLTSAVLFRAGASTGGADYADNDANKLLIAHFDTGVGLPFTPDGSSITFQFGTTNDLTDVVVAFPL